MNLSISTICEEIRYTESIGKMYIKWFQKLFIASRLNDDWKSEGEEGNVQDRIGKVCGNNGIFGARVIQI